MHLLVGLGSNIENKKQNIKNSVYELKELFGDCLKSNLYISDPVEYKNQPQFLNQVLQFKLPNMDPFHILRAFQSIEKKMGRKKIIPKGPRLIDIDLLFFGHLELNHSKLTIPHPKAFERSFVILPLKELPSYDYLSQKFTFSETFKNTAEIYCNKFQ